MLPGDRGRNEPHKKGKDIPEELGIYSPFPSWAGQQGLGNAAMATSQALKAVCGSKFPIRWSVTAVFICAFCTDLHDFLRNTVLFLSSAEILPWSWVKQSDVGKRKFVFVFSIFIYWSILLRLAPTCPWKYTFALWVCMAWWHCRHCSRASGLPECTGEATISTP